MASNRIKWTPDSVMGNRAWRSEVKTHTVAICTEPGRGFSATAKPKGAPMMDPRKTIHINNSIVHPFETPDDAMRAVEAWWDEQRKQMN